MANKILTPVADQIKNLKTRKHTQQKNKVEVQMWSDDIGKYTVFISVCSTHKPGLKARNEVDPGLANGLEDLRYRISVSAAACAEHLAENYGDVMDPEKCAKVAVEAFNEICLHMEKTGSKGGSSSAVY